MGSRRILRAGEVTAELPELGDTYSLECWVWNGLPNDARAVTGYFFSRDQMPTRRFAATIWE